MKSIEWGVLIVSYLFLGGLSAGAFFASALATYLQQNGNTQLQRIARWGAMLAPWPVSIGSALLIFDLGNWYRFYKLFAHFRIVSPMSIGAWLLMLFTLVALLYLWSWLEPEEKGRLFAALPKPLQGLRRFDRDLSEWRRSLALLGVPLSVGVGIYTGVLLGAVQSRPFWNTNLVAQLFLFSALSSGCAALIILLSMSKASLTPSEFRFLYTLDVVLIMLEFAIVMPYLIHGELSVEAVKRSLTLILGGPFTIMFWVFFLGFGLLFPLGMELWEMLPVLSGSGSLHYNRVTAFFAAFLVLTGGFLLRYIFVYAGQISRFP
jgi:formate-dependent nitrite reductase membrane component NrfD